MNCNLYCLYRYVADGRRRRYHSALHSLELAVDKIAIITSALNEPGITPESVSEISAYTVCIPLANLTERALGGLLNVVSSLMMQNISDLRSLSAA